MVEKNKNMTILKNGEVYIRPDKHRGGGGEKEFSISYTQARDNLKENISRLKNRFRKIPSHKRMESELVYCVRVFPGFLAKSYYPNSLFKDSWRWLEEIGSRRWDYKNKNNELIKSKLYFVRSSIDGLNYFNKKLDRSKIELTDAWIKDIRKIQSLSFLKKEEMLMGFDNKWQKGNVEIVVQPFGKKNKDAIKKIKDFLIKSSLSSDRIRSKVYDSGISFVSSPLNRDVLNEFDDFNIVRGVHPVRLNFPETRMVKSGFSAPKINKENYNPEVEVGMFDGGTHKNSAISDFISETSLTKIKSNDSYKDHGTGVAGTILFGDISNYSETEIINSPEIKVKSYRVLPNNYGDIELYDVIDAIENLIDNKNKDKIKIYNLSLGPIGPILDDHITRFTYALDRLAEKYNILFIVAVGNDGGEEEPLNRIQAPSDMVNGIGVGSYVYDNNDSIVRAPYSCVGRGREGCKVKPDLTAFGGSSKSPFHLFGNESQRYYSSGTSFSAPLVANFCAKLINQFDEEISPLTLRALLIHFANHPEDIVDIELGYGKLPNDVLDILLCSSSKVSTIYKGTLYPAKYAQIPIFIPELNGYENRDKINIRWTIATLSKTSPLHVEDYTMASIKDTFYPNKYKFTFKSSGRSKVVDVIEEEELAKELLNKGWKKSKSPKSNSSELYKDEEELREEKFKWDTIVHREKNKWYSSVKEPYIKIHALDRLSNSDKIDFSIITTVELKDDYSGNLYNDTVQTFNRLESMKLRSRSENRIQNR